MVTQIPPLKTWAQPFVNTVRKERDDCRNVYYSAQGLVPEASSVSATFSLVSPSALHAQKGHSGVSPGLLLAWPTGTCTAQAAREPRSVFVFLLVTCVTWSDSFYLPVSLFLK